MFRAIKSKPIPFQAGKFFYPVAALLIHNPVIWRNSMPHVIPNKQDLLKVRISERAFRRIVVYAYRYANGTMNSKNWREVYGILIGAVDKQNDGIIQIFDAIPMVVGERAGVNFEARQYVDMASIDASLFEKSTKRGLAQFLVGWWHTHPGFGFFFSQVDTMTQLGYQIANPNAVGLIFDHTQHSLYDCGLECLNLDDPTALMRAGHDFVIFELENYESLLSSTREWAEGLQRKLKTAEKTLNYIDNNLRKKMFAQLQRNYGLLLVRKNLSKDEKQEVLGEDEETWIWDELYLETMYRIPVFRKRLEHLLKSPKTPKRKKAVAERIRQFLKRPQELVAEITSTFWKRLNSIANVYLYLDTRERQVIEVFEQRLQEYWQILNALLKKAGDLLEEKEGIPMKRSRRQPLVTTENKPSTKDITPPEQFIEVDANAGTEIPTRESGRLPEPVTSFATQSQNVIALPATKLDAPIVFAEEREQEIPKIEKNIPVAPEKENSPVILDKKDIPVAPVKKGIAVTPEKENSPVMLDIKDIPVVLDKKDVINRVIDIIRRDKKVSVSNIADTLRVPSRIIWEFLVNLDVDGNIECDFDGEVFTLLSDVSKFNKVTEEKLRDKG